VSHEERLLASSCRSVICPSACTNFTPTG